MKGIIFSLEDVIVYTEEYHYKAWKKIADEMDVYFDDNIYDRLRGINRMDGLEVLLEKYKGVMTLSEKIVTAERKKAFYLELISEMSAADLEDEVTTAIYALRDRGYKLAVASTGSNAHLILDRIGFNDYFDAVAEGGRISDSKPDPEVFLKAAGMLKIHPGELMVVSGNEAGIDAAKAGGFRSAAIGEAAYCGKGTVVLDTLEDILKICVRL